MFNNLRWLLFFSTCLFMSIVFSSPAFDSRKENADDGDMIAMWEVALAFEKGDGTIQDVESAVQYYKKAGSKGHKDACLRLAYLYEHGVYLRKNMHAATYWKTRAGLSSQVKTVDKVNETPYKPMFGEERQSTTSDSTPSTEINEEEFKNVEDLLSEYNDSTNTSNEDKKSEDEKKSDVANAKETSSQGAIQSQGENKDSNGTPTIGGDVGENLSTSSDSLVNDETLDWEDSLQDDSSEALSVLDEDEPLITKRKLIFIFLFVVFAASFFFLLFSFFKKKDDVVL